MTPDELDFLRDNAPDEDRKQDDVEHNWELWRRKLSSSGVMRHRRVWQGRRRRLSMLGQLAYPEYHRSNFSLNSIAL